MLQLLRFLLFIIEYNAVALLTFSLFRLLNGRRDVQLKVIGITTTMSLIAYYLFEIAHMPGIILYFIPVFMIVTVTTVLSMPIFFSTIIGLIFTLIGFVTEILIGSVADLTGLSSYAATTHNPYIMTMIQAMAALITFAFAYVLNVKKWGFMFKKHSMYGKNVFSKYNVIFGSALVFLLCTIAIFKQTYLQAEGIIHPIIFFCISGALVGSLIYSWQKNKKALTTRSLENFEKRKMFK